jgi:catechol 2,3-dioxygenase-like lactoylglutathione lyase family enzyme
MGVRRDSRGRANMSGGSISAEARIGHVHLRVSDLDRSIRFYRDLMGFDLVARLGDEAAFLSAGGYHHHIGLNTWESAGGPPSPRGTTGLYHFAVNYPERRDLAVALKRLLEAGRSNRRRLRPRHPRGDLPARPRPQRHRAGLGPRRGRVAEEGRRAHLHEAPTRLRRPDGRAPRARA